MSSVRPLLRAYLDALDEAASRPKLFSANPKGAGDRWRLPLVRRLLLYCLLQHISRSSAALKRRYQARAAVSSEAESLKTEITSLDNFVQSLGSVPYKRLVLAVFIVVFLLAFLLARFVLESAGQSAALGRILEAALKLDRSGVVDAARSFTPATYLSTVFIVATSAWLVLCLPAASFRFKRLLFSDDGGSDKDSSIYRLEQEAFAAVSAKPPSEFRLDLLASTVFAFVPLWLAAVFLTFATLVATGRVDAISGLWQALPFYCAGATTLAWITQRLRTIRRAARAPTERGAGASHPPSAPLVKGLGRLMRLGVAAALLAAFVVLLDPPLVGSGAGVELAGPVSLRIDGMRVLGTNISGASYLRLTRQLQTSLTSGQRQERGLGLSFIASMSGPLQHHYRSQYLVRCLMGVCLLEGRFFRSGSFLSHRGPELGVPKQKNTPAPGDNTRSLFLLNFSSLARGVERRQGIRTLRARVRMWIPLQLQGLGQAILRIAIVDDQGTALVAADARILPNGRVYVAIRGGTVRSSRPA